MRRRPLPIALAALSLATACGPTKHLTLDLRDVSITVPRVVSPVLDLVPPATSPVPVSLPALPPIQTLLPPVPVRPAPSPPVCPSASPFATPKYPASILFAKPPAEGTYYQGAITIYQQSRSAPLSAPSLGLIKVTIKHLPSTVTSGGQKIDSWSVEEVDATRKSRAVELYDLVHASSSLTATAGGIYLVGLAYKDPILGDLSFQPTGNGLEVLPVPVATASNKVQYVGAATDPSSLTTMALLRNVTGRKRVDVCGQLADTFTVAMSGALTSGSTVRQIQWTQQLATAYGGFDVESTLSISSTATGFGFIRQMRSLTMPKEVS